MVNVDLYNQKGEKIGSADLPKNIFSVKLNPDLVKQAYVAQMANARVAIAHTKTRGEVRGGGIKPWRQKGTGRARHGSIRSPLWIGGGVTFGPSKERNFSKKINKKQKQKALFMVLSSKLNDKELVLVDKLEFGEIKTKKAKEFTDTLLSKVLKVDYGKMLVVLPSDNKELVLSLRNIPYVKIAYANSLNIADLLHYRYIVLLKDSIDVIKNTFVKLSK